MPFKLLVLAWGHIVLGAFGLVAGFIVCLGVGLTPGETAQKTLAFIGPIYLGLSLLYFVPAVVGGIGLLMRAVWGQFLIVGLSLLLLLLIPVGTLLGAVGLWVMLDRETVLVFAQRKAARASSPAMQAPVSTGRTGFFLVIIGVGAAFVVAIGAGFKISGDIAPMEITNAFYPAVVVLALVIVYGLMRFVMEPPRWAASALERRLGAQDLRAEDHAIDSARRAYEADKTRTATCEHLNGIERTMRDGGIRVRLETDAHVSADCRINVDAFNARYAELATVRYTEPVQYERSNLNPPGAVLLCDACRSSIRAVHASHAKTTTPWFPAPSVG